MRRSWRNAAITLFILAVVTGGLLGDRLLALSDQTVDTLHLYTDLVKVAHERYGAPVAGKLTSALLHERLVGRGDLRRRVLECNAELRRQGRGQVRVVIRR